MPSHESVPRKTLSAQTIRCKTCLWSFRPALNSYEKLVSGPPINFYTMQPRAKG